MLFRFSCLARVTVFRFVSEGTVEEKIVERAEKKLFLDAVVVQQGRLQEVNKGLSKGELMTMVKFGAESIFKATGGTITDEDMQACVLDKAKALEFPALSRDGIKASYPYLFTTDRTPPEVVRALKVRHGLIPPDPVGDGDLTPEAEPARGEDGWYETW